VGQVTVRVNGYGHTIGCKDGEEQHVLDLIQQIEEKVRVIRSMGGQFSESRMLLHVALLLADESSDLRQELADRRAGGAAVAPTGGDDIAPTGGDDIAPTGGDDIAPTGGDDPALAQRLDRVTARIEALADAIARG
jgi:cell division protein ZapA